MDDASGVGGIEGVGNLDGQGKHRLQFHGPVADQVLERDAVEELHHEEMTAAFLADVIDGTDIGMVQGRSGLGLAAEALQCLAVLGEIVGQKLQGDEAAEAGVFGLVDDAHAAAAELFDDPVMRDGLFEHFPRSGPGSPRASSPVSHLRGGKRQSQRKARRGWGDHLPLAGASAGTSARSCDGAICLFSYAVPRTLPSTQPEAASMYWAREREPEGVYGRAIYPGEE